MLAIPFNDLQHAGFFSCVLIAASQRTSGKQPMSESTNTQSKFWQSVSWAFVVWLEDTVAPVCSKICLVVQYDVAVFGAHDG